MVCQILAGYVSGELPLGEPAMVECYSCTNMALLTVYMTVSYQT